MITPTQSITVPAANPDGIWLTNITISAPNTTGKISATFRCVPYDSATGTLYSQLGKTIAIPDVNAAAQATPSITTAMTGIFSAVQDYITANSTF